ncbi:zinc-binding dehydrogenase [bacterium]|nr:zinc-binding dehydrogenase [bacterium]
MDTMVAAVTHEHGDRDVVRLESVPIPEPGEGEVRLQVRACALNWLDVGIRRGPKFGSIPLPIITGSDIAGVVETVGAGVSAWNSGDKVLVYPLVVCNKCEFCRRGEPTTCPDHRIIGEHINGGLASYTVVPANNLLPKPPQLSFVEAAAIPVVFMTAWHMLISKGALQANEDVLVLGAGGGVASAGIQLARYFGARVLATSSSEEKCRNALKLGVAKAFNYREKNWHEQVLQYTDGRGVDIIQDNVGAATWPTALGLLARNGRLVACGSHSGSEVTIDMAHVYHRQLSILGSNGGTLADLTSVLGLMTEGRLRPVIDTVLPLDQIHKGHRLLEEGGHFGKVVVEIA